METLKQRESPLLQAPLVKAGIVEGGHNNRGHPVPLRPPRFRQAAGSPMIIGVFGLDREVQGAIVQVRELDTASKELRECVPDRRGAPAPRRRRQILRQPAAQGLITIKLPGDQERAP